MVDRHVLNESSFHRILLILEINTLRPGRNGRHFADDTFKPIFLNENIGISIKISLQFVPKFQINNIPALVQIMAWRLVGAKPLSELMMVWWLTHICVTRPQCVNQQIWHYECGGQFKFALVKRNTICQFHTIGGAVHEDDLTLLSHTCAD